MTVSSPMILCLCGVWDALFYLEWVNGTWPVAHSVNLRTIHLIARRIISLLAEQLTVWLRFRVLLLCFLVDPPPPPQGAGNLPRQAVTKLQP